MDNVENQNRNNGNRPNKPFFSHKRVKIAMISILVVIVVWCILFFTIFFVLKSRDDKQNDIIIENKIIHPVIVISIDGFRHDFLERGITPNIKSIYEGSNQYTPGVRAKYMTPQFPSKTFPNHYTLATGLYPESHGIVSNIFYDPILNDTFSNKFSGSIVNNRKWWLGEPIWETTTKRNISTACYFWPGCGAFSPLYNIQNFTRTPVGTMLKQVFDWQLNEKPKLTMVYLYDVDYSEHKSIGGPDSDPVNQTIIEVDKEIGILIQNLIDNGIYDTTNIIILSDHGMTTMKTSIDVTPFVNTTNVYAPDISPTLSVYENNIGGEQAVIDTYNKLKSANLTGLNVYLKNEIPAEYKYKDSNRIPPLFAVADEGYEILLNTKPYVEHGEHGYNNTLPNMRAIFLGHGPNIKNNITDFYFENIEIYNFLATLLNISDAPTTNGTNYLSDLLYKK